MLRQDHAPGEKMFGDWAGDKLEIFRRGARVASHVRRHGNGKAITIEQHRPKSHQTHLECTPSRMVNWAATVGPHIARLLERILGDKPHPEMGYRGCLGIIRLAELFGVNYLSRSRTSALFGSDPAVLGKSDPGGQ